MRLRIAWPVGTRLHWQASKDLGALAPTIVNGVNQIVATFTNPTLPDDLERDAKKWAPVFRKKSRVNKGS